MTKDSVVELESFRDCMMFIFITSWQLLCFGATCYAIGMYKKCYAIGMYKKEVQITILNKSSIK
jgi:hypothetical protein